jgi:uncharacterized protein
MAIKEYLNTPFRVETPADGLTVVHVAPGATVPPHPHSEGYVVVPFWPASVERITHQDDRVIRVEPLRLQPLVPYYVEATKPDQTISLRNTGTGVSAFQKMKLCPPITGPQSELRTEKVTIISQANQRHMFTVEMAVTLVEQAVGLMFRPQLAPDRGMIFVWSPGREVAMYMRNTLVPLDFLFVDESHRIARIYQNAAPEDSAPIPSQGPVIYTVEIPGGTVARLGIATGDTIE